MSSIPDEILSEIRARLPVSQIVGRKVKLRKAGSEFRGLSPFGRERTPSFFVNDQKGMWFDFSAGKNGNIFGFVMETEGLSFREAVERLAAEAGVTLPAESPQRAAEIRVERSLREIVEMAVDFYQRALGLNGNPAADYLDQRGVTRESRSRFSLGYAPATRTALLDFLRKRGVGLDMMAEAGLIVTGERDDAPYDRFRNRVMFPIFDAQGRAVAFGGRALNPDARAKYLNSPETALFHKGGLLYNHHLARIAAHETGMVVVVEGYLDVIALDQVGIKHAVAPLGTALTAEQLRLLWRMAPEPILCFDGDAAGRRAATKGMALALPQLAPNASLRFAMMPQGQDPDDIARDRGLDGVNSFLRTAVPLVDQLWMTERTRGPTDTPERISALETRLMDACDRIDDRAVRSQYRSEMIRRLRAAFSAKRKKRDSLKLSSRALALFTKSSTPDDDSVGAEEERRIMDEGGFDECE